ncbi:MAG: SpoIIE family protein phosphatase [Clostridia bacterium]|nr:SpoIIE family protein phosphatase [Clostridia bacterium]
MAKFLKYFSASALAFVAFVCMNGVITAPLSLSLYVALLYAGIHPLPMAIAYVAASAVQGYPVAVISGPVGATLIGALFLIYSKKKRKPNAEIIIYIFLSSIVYLLFDERAETVQKLVYMAIITLFAGTCSVAVKAAWDKGFSIKYQKGESVCLAALLFVLGVGIYGVLGAGAYKGLSVFILLAFVALFDDETPAIATFALSSVFVLTEGEAKYCLPYFCYYIAAYSVMKRGRMIATIFVLSIEALFAFVFEYYSAYGYVEAIFFAAPCLVFALLPQKLFLLGDGGYLSPENALTKSALNDMRSYLSKTISDTANSFSEMRSSLLSMTVSRPSDKMLASKIAAGVKKSCEDCKNYARCLAGDNPPIHILEKIAQVGIAKKRITIIDLPKEFLDFCVYPNNVIFEVNRLIEGFSEIKEKAEKTDSLKRILAVLAGGMEEALRDLSAEFSAVLPYDGKAEKEVLKDFAKSGVKIKGITLRGNGEDTEINLLYDKKTFDENAAKRVLKDRFGFEFEKSYFAAVNGRISAALFTKKTELSLAYGVSSVTKFSSSKSGDMHSVERLKKDKVLVALSDGMGSGESANSSSAAAITLIEAFYKAGFKSKSVLPLVNKILSSVTEDDFSAVDVCVLDTESGHCDFLKIGAPYGFILSKEGVRFLEGSSLPLGILDVLTPTVASTTLKKGDILILLSDGVTDAFGSSSDVRDFLKTAPVLNPQELADSVVKRALSLSGGIAEDDMTAFCTRIY